jgi:hypothetical protein
MVIFEIIPERLARFHPNRTNFSFDNLAFHLNSLFLSGWKHENKAEKGKRRKTSIFVRVVSFL